MAATWCCSHAQHFLGAPGCGSTRSAARHAHASPRLHSLPQMMHVEYVSLLSGSSAQGPPHVSARGAAAHSPSGQCWTLCAPSAALLLPLWVLRGATAYCITVSTPPQARNALDGACPGLRAGPALLGMLPGNCFRGGCRGPACPDSRTSPAQQQSTYLAHVGIPNVSSDA